MDTKDLALRLARLRVKKGVSAREMSLFLGQNPSYINHIEIGKNVPSMEGFFNICEYLNITPKEFFDYEVSDPSKVDAIAEDMKKLNDEQLATVAAVVKGFTKK